MVVTLAVVVGGLFAAGTYLIQQRTLTRVVLGFGLLAHAVNLLLLAAGGRAGRAPVLGLGRGRLADPLPQAMALTAIVISFGIAAFLMTLAYRSWVLTRDDEVQDDPEDRRIVALGEGRRGAAADGAREEAGA